MSSEHKAALEDEKFKFTCLKCNYKHNDPEAFRLHAISHISELFRCGKCFFETNRKELFTMHQQEHLLTSKTKARLYTINIPRSKPREETPVMKLKCSNCTFRTNSVGSLKLHSFVHNKQMFSCFVCDYKTNFEKLLEMHEETHLQTNVENRLTCNYCPYITYRESSLESHLLIHKEQERKCIACGFKTVNESELEEHRCQKNKKNIRCPICGYVASSISKFHKHMDTHTTTQVTSVESMISKNFSNGVQDSKLADKKKNMSWSLEEKKEIYWCHMFARHKIFGKFGVSRRQMEMLESRRVVDFKKISEASASKLVSLVSHIKGGVYKIPMDELKEIENDVNNYVKTHLTVNSTEARDFDAATRSRQFV